MVNLNFKFMGMVKIMVMDRVAVAVLVMEGQKPVNNSILYTGATLT